LKRNNFVKPRIITLFGSGETSPHMAKSYRDIKKNFNLDLRNNYLLDTPYGFQENNKILSNKIVEYFNSKVDLNIESLDFSNPNSDKVLIKNKIKNADFIFSGPGSPTYALNIWKEFELDKILESKIKNGVFIAFASAAALTFGTYVIPVYEIYKVGEDKSLVKGLDLLKFLGKETIVVPHFNNKEGGDHDTSYCFIGEKRFNKLISSKDMLVIGIEEHTSMTFNLDDSNITVEGRGNVILKSKKGTITIKRGESLGIKNINTNYIPLPADDDVQSENKKNEQILIDVEAIISIRNQARSKKIWNISDQIRDILSENNIDIEDNADGSEWEKN